MKEKKEIQYIKQDLVNNVGNFDDEGGYKYYLVNGVKTKVYIKYLTGITDIAAQTLVAHGLAGLPAKLESGNSMIGTDATNFRLHGDGGNWRTAIDNTNVELFSVAAGFQGDPYRIKLEYYL